MNNKIRENYIKSMEKRYKEIISSNSKLKREDFPCFNHNSFNMPFKLDDNALNLYRYAVKENNISKTKIALINEICLGILRFEGVKIGKSEHIAEAIQYVLN